MLSLKLSFASPRVLLLMIRGAIRSAQTHVMRDGSILSNGRKCLPSGSRRAAQLALAIAAGVALVAIGAPQSVESDTSEVASRSPTAAVAASPAKVTPRSDSAAGTAGLPRVLRQWHGWTFSGPPLIRWAIVYQLSAWRQAWRALHVQPMPDVDFHAALAVIVSTDGPEPSFGYFIKFNTLYREHGELIVPYCVIAPHARRMAIIYPWAAMLIQSRSRKIVVRDVCPETG
jgi:hypothetical protein